jgi:hypothetical protein
MADLMFLFPLSSQNTRGSSVPRVSNRGIRTYQYYLRYRKEKEKNDSEKGISLA